MDTQLLQTFLIVALAAFILGMVVGALLVRPRTYSRSNRWEDRE